MTIPPASPVSAASRAISTAETYRSAQNQQVEPVASRLRVRLRLGRSDSATETLLPALELVLAEVAQRGVGVAKRVDVAEEVGESGRPRLTNLLERDAVESCGAECLACLLDGREGVDRPDGLGEPSDELDPVVSVR